MDPLPEIQVNPFRPAVKGASIRRGTKPSGTMWRPAVVVVCVGCVLAAVGAAFAYLQPLERSKQKQRTLPGQVARKQPNKNQAKRQRRSDPAVADGIPTVPNMNSLLSDTVGRMQSLNQELQRSKQRVRTPETPSPLTGKSAAQEKNPAQPSANQKPNAASGEKGPSVPSAAPAVQPHKLETKNNSVGTQLVLVPPGRFRMGADGEAVDVVLTKPFWIGRYEVTQGEWKQVMGDSNRGGRGDAGRVGDRLPAINIGWTNAVAFCEQLTKRERAAGLLSGGQNYRLPTEAEWEYACRAGTTTKFSFGESDSLLTEYAWCYANTCEADEHFAHEVGRKKPNAWGIHDMHGNVQEWCWDEFAKRLPGGEDPFTPPRKGDYSRSTSDPGGYRTVRGGNWQEFPHFHQSCFRVGQDGESFASDRIGFRVVLTDQ